MSEDDICKKKTGVAFAAVPTKSTLDAVEHEQDLMNQRRKHADSSIIIENPVNAARKSGTDTGNLQKVSQSMRNIQSQKIIPMQMTVKAKRQKA